MEASTREETARRAVESVPLWYHAIEVAPGVVTPGWFDLRPIVERMPWPDVTGKRCLDVGPWDGFLSFELERRGAAEVVAVDIGDYTQWDWPAATRALGPEVMAAMAGPEVGAGFRVARDLLGSKVELVTANVYELGPELLGRFDVVVCGTLMLHLRDPVRALEAIRSVCDGWFLSAEQIDLGLTFRYRRRPVVHFKAGEECVWWVPNATGHRELITSGGYSIERQSRPYVIPLGPAHPSHDGSRPLRRRLLMRLMTRNEGVPHSALLARPSIAG